VIERLVLFIVMCVGLQVSLAYSQVLTLANAVEAAEANNRTIQIAQLQRQAAVADVQAARTQRLPVFSMTALGSQPLTQLGVTLERGSLVYPADGPIPGRTTTLRSPLQLQKADLDRRLKSAERIPDVSLSFNALRTVNFSSVLPNNVTSIGLQVSWDVLSARRPRRFRRDWCDR
jgi:outer membrane protein TolC